MFYKSKSSYIHSFPRLDLFQRCSPLYVTYIQQRHLYVRDYYFDDFVCTANKTWEMVIFHSSTKTMARRILFDCGQLKACPLSSLLVILKIDGLRSRSVIPFSNCGMCLSENQMIIIKLGIHDQPQTRQTVSIVMMNSRHDFHAQNLQLQYCFCSNCWQLSMSVAQLDDHTDYLETCEQK